MSKRPWMKFYPADWRADPKLRVCSLAARGLWIEMLALMHEAEPYGHLRVGGRAASPAQLASLVGGIPREVSRLVSELEDAGVFSRTEDGTIYSRRMERDKAKAERDREHGTRGGNPRLKGKDKGGVNPQDNGGDKAHIPEARYSEAKASAPVDLKAVVFGQGLDWLAGQSGKAKDSLRSVAGKWCRDFGEPAVIEVLGAAQRQGPLDPVPWIEQALKARKSTQKPTGACPL